VRRPSITTMDSNGTTPPPSDITATTTEHVAEDMSALSTNGTVQGGIGSCPGQKGNGGHSLEATSQRFFDYEIQQREEEAAAKNGNAPIGSASKQKSYWKTSPKRAITKDQGASFNMGTFICVTLYADHYTSKEYADLDDGPPCTVVKNDYPREVVAGLPAKILPITAITTEIMEWVKKIQNEQLHLLISHFWSILQPFWSDVLHTTTDDVRNDKHFMETWYVGRMATMSQPSFDRLPEGNKRLYEVSDRGLLHRRVEPDKVVFLSPHEVCDRPPTITLEDFDYMVVYRRYVCHRIEYVLRQLKVAAVSSATFLDYVKQPGRVMIASNSVGREDASSVASSQSTGSLLQVTKHPPFADWPYHTEMSWLHRDFTYHHSGKRPNFKAGVRGGGIAHEILFDDDKGLRIIRTDEPAKERRFHGQRPYHAWWVSQFTKESKKAYSKSQKKAANPVNVGTRTTPLPPEATEVALTPNQSQGQDKGKKRTQSQKDLFAKAVPKKPKAARQETDAAAALQNLSSSKPNAVDSNKLTNSVDTVGSTPTAPIATAALQNLSSSKPNAVDSSLTAKRKKATKETGSKPKSKRRPTSTITLSSLVQARKRAPVTKGGSKSASTVKTSVPPAESKNPVAGTTANDRRSPLTASQTPGNAVSAAATSRSDGVENAAVASNVRPPVNQHAKSLPTQANRKAKTTGKSSTTIAPIDAYHDFIYGLADGNNEVSRSLVAKGKSRNVTIKDLQAKNDTAYAKLEKAGQKVGQRFEEKVVNPIREYKEGLESALAFTLSEYAKLKSKEAPPMPLPQPADVDGERCKALAKELVSRKNDCFPFRKRLNNDYWDGGKSSGIQAARDIVFPKLEGEVLTKEEQSEVIQEVMNYRNIRERTIRDTFKKYIPDTQYFMTPVKDESIVDLKERHLNSFFRALVKGNIKRADDERYMAFKEALAPLLVTQFRILEGENIVRAGNIKTNPTQRSTRNTRIKEMFRHTQTVQSLASKYEVSFVALVICDQIRKRERARMSLAGGNDAVGKEERRSNSWKSGHWKEKGLAIYAQFVKCFDALWTKDIPEGEDFIYPLVIEGDKGSDEEFGDLLADGADTSDDDDNPRSILEKKSKPKRRREPTTEVLAKESDSEETGSEHESEDDTSSDDNFWPITKQTSKRRRTFVEESDCEHEFGEDDNKNSNSD
jgi:hypothetical protein